MDIFTFQCQSGISSDDQITLSNQMNKTKQLHTKFLTELNKLQKSHHRRKDNRNSANQTQFQPKRKDYSQKKNNKRSPTFKQLFMQSKKFLTQEPQQSDFGQFPQRRKVKFQKTEKSQNNRTKTNHQRKTSIQKLSPFNFCETIKQMALEITEGKKLTEGDKHQLQQNTDQSLFSGYTEKQFQDGTKFKGICEKGVILKGQLHFTNNFVYDGELFLDKFHGKGKLILPKKQIIQGDWVQGEIVGKATIKYPKGQIYYGDLKNLRRHGKGHLFFTQGSKYQGQFTQGQLTGYGVFIDTLGQKTAGYWFYGDYVGNNQLIYQNIMTNFTAHQKKKTQKVNNKIKNLRRSRVQKKSSKQDKQRIINQELQLSHPFENIFSNFIMNSSTF